MKEESRQALLGLGMDLEQTLARFVGNEALLFKFLNRFLDDKTFGQLTEAIEQGQTEEAFRAAHTLKGVAGNLGLGSLFDAVSPLVEALRSTDPTPISAMYTAVKAAYELALQTIRELQEGA